MEGFRTNSQDKRQALVVGALVLLVVPELMLLEFKVEWLWSAAQALLPNSEYTYLLEKCPPEVRVLKSQHLAALTMLLPLKALCIYMWSPLRFQNLDAKGPLAMAWGLLVILLYTLLGMVFAYIMLFMLPGSSTLSSSSTFANLSSCAQPTLAYAVKYSLASVIAALCLWPLVAIASSLCHWLFVAKGT